jgi:hypothetical protein
MKKMRYLMSDLTIKVDPGSHNVSKALNCVMEALELLLEAESLMVKSGIPGADDLIAGLSDHSTSLLEFGKDLSWVEIHFGQEDGDSDV